MILWLLTYKEGGKDLAVMLQREKRNIRMALMKAKPRGWEKAERRRAEEGEKKVRKEEWTRGKLNSTLRTVKDGMTYEWKVASIVNIVDHDRKSNELKISVRPDVARILGLLRRYHCLTGDGKKNSSAKIHSHSLVRNERPLATLSDHSGAGSRRPCATVARFHPQPFSAGSIMAGFYEPDHRICEPRPLPRAGVTRGGNRWGPNPVTDELEEKA